jgi:hypothetical protein
MKGSMESIDSHEVREMGQRMKPRHYSLKVELPKYSGELGKYEKFPNLFVALIKMSKVETADWLRTLGHVWEDKHQTYSGNM